MDKSSDLKRKDVEIADLFVTRSFLSGQPSLQYKNMNQGDMKTSTKEEAASSTIFDIHRLTPEKSIFWTCMLVVLILIQVRYDYKDGNPVPAVVFNGQPSVFHAFLVVLSLAFSGAVTAMSPLCEIYPKASRFCRGFSLVAMAAAFGILLWAIVV